MKIIQISDIHLGTPGEIINGCYPYERLLSCFEDIVTWHSDAEFCVITGDLTEFAEPAAYKFLRSLIKKIPIQCYLMLGNHDNRTVFQSVFDDYFQDENGYVQYSLKTKNGVFLFLDTKRL